MAHNALLGMTVPDDEWRMTRAVNALGFGPMTQATQAGRQNALLSAVATDRPNDYLAPVAETISPTMGGYGAGQMMAEGSRAIGQGDYLGGGAGLALGMAGMIPGAPKKGIRAFHGSPHDFDRFSLDKIGTGEGAQAYGHGLYFAEKQEVARAYEGMLAGNGYDPAVIARYALIASDGDAAKALERIARETPPKMGLPEMDILTDNYGVASQIMQDHIAGEPMPLPARGRMYEVRINADPEDFLDWDKPLSQQSEKVREAALGIRNKAARAEYEARGFPEPLIKEYLTNAARADKTGGQVVQGMKGAGQSGDFSQALREAGIPGIKYLDQGSRGAGDGSRNYVVFRDDIIEIVKKYGLAAAVSTYGFDAVRGAMEDQQQ